MVDEDLAEAAAAAVDADEVLAFARALISAPSENPGGTEDEAAAVATDILTGLGASPETIRGDEERPSVVASIGSGERPSLAWNGHLDVVPVGDLANWRHGPWDGVVEDGRLIGRGSADMKGPVASALAAAAALRRAGIDLAGTLTFHLAADEEHMGLYGTKVLCDRGMLVQDACIVGEPSDLRVGLAERGGAWIIATAKGTGAARLHARPRSQRHHVDVPVRAASRGGAPRSRAPARRASERERRGHHGRQRPQRRARSLRAPHRPADHPGRDGSCAGAGTVRPAGGGHHAGASRGRPDVRDRRVDRGGGGGARHGHRRSGPRAIAAERGAVGADVGFTGITDARFYINDVQIPTIIMGPGSLSVAHTANEWVLVDDLVAAARIYARIFVGFIGARAR